MAQLPYEERLSQAIAAAEKAVVEWIPAANEAKVLYLYFAERLTGMRKNVNISKIVGSVGSLVVGLPMIVIGTGALPFTLGASSGLVLAGIGVSTTGGVVAGGASLVEFGIRKSGMKGIQEKEKRLNELTDAVSETYVALRAVLLEGAMHLDQPESPDDKSPVKYISLVLVDGGRIGGGAANVALRLALYNGDEVIKVAVAGSEVAQASSKMAAIGSSRIAVDASRVAVSGSNVVAGGAKAALGSSRVAAKMPQVAYSFMVVPASRMAAEGSNVAFEGSRAVFGATGGRVVLNSVFTVAAAGIDVFNIITSAVNMAKDNNEYDAIRKLKVAVSKLDKIRSLVEKTIKRGKDASNRGGTQGVLDDAAQADVFRCCIDLCVAQPPVVACRHCQSFLGCQGCMKALCECPFCKKPWPKGACANTDIVRVDDETLERLRQVDDGEV